MTKEMKAGVKQIISLLSGIIDNSFIKDLKRNEG
jgi:hypothetical protein